MRKLLAGHLKRYFFFDGPRNLRRSVEKLDSDPHASDAVTDFTASLDQDTGARQPKPQLHDRAFGVLRPCVDKHAVRAKVWRPHGNLFVGPLINHGEFT